MLRPFAHPVACCWMLLRVVAQNLKPVKLFSQQPLTFVWFRDRRSVAQQCWIGVCTALRIPTLLGPRTLITHGFSKTYGFYSSHNALQDPNLLGVANTHAIAPNIVGATMLGVVATLYQWGENKFTNFKGRKISSAPTWQVCRTGVNSPHADNLKGTNLSSGVYEFTFAQSRVWFL